MPSVAEQIRALSRGAVELISEEEFARKLSRGEPLRVKLGLDPTIADIHLGHTVVIQKLKQFQDFGHQVIFLVGDTTAQVGDPSGQSKTRPTLTEKEVKANAATYLDQAFKILDKKQTTVRKNSEWLGKMRPMELIRLAGHYNVARMLEREDFKTRYREGASITVQEFLYPLLQGYDSVALEADVELGGSDQKFNLAVARDIQRAYGQEPEILLTMPLLVGTDGAKKMSKSYGNTIGISEPPGEMFGKIMSLSDDQMWHYFELLTEENIDELKKGHPKEAKITLGKILVGRYHSEKEAKRVAEQFDAVFAKGGKPETIESFSMKPAGKTVPLIDVLVASGLATSKGEARRLIGQRGVRVDDAVVESGETVLTVDRDYVVQVGRRRFKKVEFLR